MALVRPEFEQIAFVQLDFRRKEDLSVADIADAPHENASVVRPSVAHDLVSTAALQIALGESSAERLRKDSAFVFGGTYMRSAQLLRKLHLVFAAKRIRRIGQAVEDATIHADHGKDVFGGFHATFDFEAVNAGGSQLYKHIDRAEVFRGKEMVALGGKGVFHRCVVERIRKTACLGAHSPIRRTTADKRAHEALPRIADAKRAVPEAFSAHSALVRRCACLRDLEQRQLARQRYTIGSAARTPSTPCVFIWVEICRRASGSTRFTSAAMPRS